MTARIFMALAIALFATTTFAKDYPAFEKLDVNKDGQLSMGEMEAVEEFNQEDEEFAESDLNNNGSMDANEYQAWQEMQASRLAAKAAKIGDKAEAKN